MVFSKKASIPTRDDPSIRRSYLSKELVTSPADGVETVADVLPWMVRATGFDSNTVDTDACLIKRTLPLDHRRRRSMATRLLVTTDMSSRLSKRRRPSPRRAERKERPRRSFGSCESARAA